MRLLRRLFLFAFIFTCSISYGQEDLFAQLDDSQEEVPFDLLPERMLFTQRLLWGEKGLMRVTGLSDLDEEHRMKELKLRKTMLNVHQVIGYATLAGMVAQGIIGGQLYNGDYSLYDTHETLGGIVTATYFTGAALSLFAPPPLISSKEIGLSGARAHKWLASVHLSAMIATQYYKERDKALHRASAYTAFGAYAAATVVIRFKQ